MGSNQGRAALVRSGKVGTPFVIFKVLKRYTGTSFYVQEESPTKLPLSNAAPPENDLLQLTFSHGQKVAL